MKIGVFLKIRRDELGLKQKDVASVIGKSGAYLTKVEKGETTPTAAFLQSIAGPLKLDFIDLYLKSLEDRDLPEDLLRDLRAYRALRPLLEPGMPIHKFLELTQNRSTHEVKELLYILERITQMITRVADPDPIENTPSQP